jgi:hypothetical protein
MLLEPACQQLDRGGKLVVERDQQIDIIEIYLAAETVGQVAWIDRGQHFATTRTEKAEVAFAPLFPNFSQSLFQEGRQPPG